MLHGSWAVGLGVAVVLAGGLAAAQAQSQTGATGQQDACLVVAGAKLAQWNQNPLLIRETKYFSDNSTRVVETVVSGSRAYAHYIGMPWNTVYYDAPERESTTPAMAAKTMRLATCQPMEPAAAGTHSYSLTYAPDLDGTRSTGQITISDASGLPVAQDIVFSTDQRKSSLPVKIAATFAYGDAAKLPKEAALAEIDARMRQQRALEQLQQRSSMFHPM